jgi:hypothetical protein
LKGVALNTLFSGLAFAGIIVSLFIQSRDAEKREFESHFFELVALSNEIVRSFSYVSTITGNKEQGKQCLVAMQEDFVQSWLKSASKAHELSENYVMFYKHGAVHEELGHYFRNLYQIIKYIHASNIADKKFYANIIRAQLSSNALYLLFLNGLSPYGREKFFPLLQHYAMFEHLPLEYKIIPGSVTAYGEKAFGSAWPEWKRYVETGVVL